MSWKVRISKQAREDLDYLRAHQPECYLEAYRMTRSIAAHPERGPGAPSRAQALGANIWYRNLSIEHRIVYEVIEETAVIASYRSHID